MGNGSPMDAFVGTPAGLLILVEYRYAGDRVGLLFVLHSEGYVPFGCCYSGPCMRIKGSGWHGQPTVPMGFTAQVQKGNLAVYSFNDTYY